MISAQDSGASDRVTGRSFATRSEVVARHGMAATSQPLATQVAIDVLKKGGSAVDAAIAANATIGLMEPTGNGIGGDIFAIVWDAKTQKLHGLNGSGRSPASLTLEEFQKRKLKSIPPFGALPVTVPGCVDGWFELHGKFGRLPMIDVLAPAIEYCNEGFPVSEVIAAGWRGSRNTFAKYPGFLDTYFPDGKGPATSFVTRNSQEPCSLSLTAAETRSTKGRLPNPLMPI